MDLSIGLLSNAQSVEKTYHEKENKSAGRIKALLLRRQNNYFGDAFGVLRQPLRPSAAAAAIDGRKRRAKLCTVLY